MRLKCVIEFNDERMVQLRTNVLLIFDDVLFLGPFDEFLQHHLHCVEIAVS